MLRNAYPFVKDRTVLLLSLALPSTSPPKLGLKEQNVMSSLSSRSVIAHFTLATRDIRQSTTFFQATMGWESINRPGNVSLPTAWLRIASGQELHLVQVADFEVSSYEREMGRHFAIAYPLSGFEALKQRLVDHGADLVEPERDTSFERFFFRDPNGYIFEIVEADHESEV